MARREWQVATDGEEMLMHDANIKSNTKKTATKFTLRNPLGGASQLNIESNRA